MSTTSIAEVKPNVVSSEIVDLAREILSLAERGELRSIVVVGEMTSRRIYHNWCVTNGSDNYALMGAIFKALEWQSKRIGEE